jgi:thiol-disulfide isomerase/thioredoxin
MSLYLDHSLRKTSIKFSKLTRMFLLSFSLTGELMNDLKKTILKPVNQTLRCFYSKQVFETWENLGEHYAYNYTNIKIAEVDCEKNKSLCRKFKIRDYPQFIMFKEGRKFEKYIGKRKLKHFINYVDSYLKSSLLEKDEY